jgi:Flp pilus assembly protein TadG
MRLQSMQAKRGGALTLESAIIYPVLFFLVLATFIGGMGIFQYQQVAYLARDTARYASAHGGEYKMENTAAITAGTLPDVTEDYLKNNIVYPQLTWIDKNNLTVTTMFNQPGSYAAWDSTANRWPTSLWTDSSTGIQYSITNTVSVTVSYQWYPLLYLGGPITLQSTSVMPMCY